MNAVWGELRDWGRGVAGVWDRFWFTPADPHSLCLIRLLGGWMMFYTHLVWTKDLRAFLGPDSWVAPEVVRELHRGSTAWSYLWYVESPLLLWILHLAALVVFAMLCVGYQTRVVSVLAWLISVAYCHRLTGALFGLDQVNTMLAMYLMLGPSGAVWSVDRWLAGRRAGGQLPGPEPSVGANVAIRLIQLHMCVIYLFGGIGKMRGELWWDGFAMWFAAANYEYQSLDMTWIGHLPLVFSLLTHLTVFWETFYCVLVWPRLTRPIALGMAVLVHGGIAIFLGMITFGTAMLIGNLAFVSPRTVRVVVGKLASWWPGQGRGASVASAP
ncbi:MAG: HTTM domain-containing protein [Pirellulaceae bacterium]|nr:HTTM domain-containing protein [Pirellulaceae bacterium]